LTAEELLKITSGEIGVKEYPANSNKVKYNTWFYGKEVSGDNYPWCMAFVQWCFNQAGEPLPYKTASCSGLLNWYKRNKPEAIVEVPEPGDIVIYNFGHTGIITGRGICTITAIEGNTAVGNESNGGEVMRRTRSTKTVTAYIRPTYKKEEKEDENMTGKEIYEALNEYLKSLEVPEWAKSELEDAVNMGITDGTNPMCLIPRCQAAIMAKRAVMKNYE
jgi:hypothetical protein